MKLENELSNNDLQKCFPFPEIRKQQADALDFAVAALKDDKKFIIIEAGTGVGKSAIGVALNRYLLKSSSSEGFLPGGYFVTTQKILQEQYLQDFGNSNGDMLSLKSSSNFQCRYHRKNTCADSLRALNGADKSSKFFRTCAFNCSYKQTKKEFIAGNEGITNFSYFLAETQYAGQLKPRNILIIDEAHNIELQLSKFIEVTISERFAGSILKLSWPGEISLAKSLKWIKEVYRPKLASHCKFVKSSLQKYLGVPERINEFANIAKKMEMLDKHLCKINRFLETFKSDNWIVNHQSAYGRTMRKIEFKPIDVSHFCNDLLFQHGSKILMMSATILDKTAFCESLGISESDAAFVSFPSPFPEENRPVIYNPIGSMSSRNIDDTLPKMAKAVKVILDGHKGEKGIIHCHSYKIAKYLKQNIRSSRLLIHNSDNREAILQKHINSKSATVLLSPSMTEGVDLKDDCSRFQVLCKIPFPYLGDKLVKKRMHKWKWWYPLQTTKTILQSTGRSIRHNEDFAITYMLDSDWDRFIGRNKKFFPQDFINCMKT
jgi:ATP-dependent DNA helicase DinG